MYVLLTLAWVSFPAFMHGQPARVSFSPPYKSEAACMSEAQDKGARKGYVLALCYPVADIVAVEPDDH